MYEVYTDGSCDNLVTKNGSWFFVITKSNKLIFELGGKAKNTTCNKMEYVALIEAFNYLKSINETDELISVYSDSELLVKTYNLWMDKWHKRNWKRKKNKEIKNIDLVKNLFSNKLLFKNTEINWIKGHSGIFWNEYANEKCSFLALS